MGNVLFISLESRLHLSGTPIATFGTRGTANVALNPHSYQYNAIDVAVDPSGREIIGATYLAHDQFSLTRLTTAGAMDYTFSGDSHVVQATEDVNSFGTYAFQIAVDHTGRTLVVFDKTIYRFKTNGQLDTSFGSGGSETVPVLTSVADLTVDAKNRPIIVGTSQGVTGTRGTVIRLGIAGVLDTSFGDGGAYKRPVPQDATFQQPGNGTGEAVAVQSDGAIVAAEEVRYKYDSDNSRDYTNGTDLFRLTANGTLDTTYGKKGHLEFDGQDDDVNSGSANLAALLPSGAAVINNDFSSFDSPTPIGSHNYDYVNSLGQTTATELTLRPKTDAYPKSAFATTNVIGADASGNLIVSTGSLVYRLNPKTFKYDSSFGLVSDDNALSALSVGTTAINLFSRSTMGSASEPAGKVLQVGA